MLPLSNVPQRTAAALAVAAALALHAAPGRADLAGRVSQNQARAAQLRARVQAESQAEAGYEGSLQSLRGRLQVIDSTLAVQEDQLRQAQGRLGEARLRLRLLQDDLRRDRALLAAELVADYETPPPSVVGVVVDARGFDDLLNRLSYVRAIELRNVLATRAVRVIRSGVERQARRLGVDVARAARVTAAVLDERDQVAQLRLSIVRRELPVARARSRDAARLAALQQVLARETAALDAQVAAADSVALASGGAAAAPAGCISGAFVPHAGTYGFFQAPGTDYSVGEEPVIAARLDALGRALGLHLIGISGYRSPQHSVEVGGFADDPHTRGEASDTPGVEGVPEATLERFCLTRPFPGAREADHIQEL